MVDPDGRALVIQANPADVQIASAIPLLKVSRGSFPFVELVFAHIAYTTGETTAECVRTLTGSGAGEVRIMTLAKDHRVFSRKVCPACGRSMKIRTNSTTNVRFWGCSGYPNHCQNTEDF